MAQRSRVVWLQRRQKYNIIHQLLCHINCVHVVAARMSKAMGRRRGAAKPFEYNGTITSTGHFFLNN